MEGSNFYTNFGLCLDGTICVCYGGVMDKDVKVTVCEETGAVYIELATTKPGGVSRTYECENGVFLDVNGDDRVLGVEILGWRLANDC